MAADKTALILVENVSVPSDRRVWQQARALTRAGVDVLVVSPQGDGRDTQPFEEREGVSIYRYAPRFAGRGVADYLREYGGALREMRRLVRRLSTERRIDVVQVCNPPDVLFLAALRPRRLGAAFVFDQHDLVPELARSHFDERRFPYHASVLAERFAYRSADVVLVTNESYRDVAIARGRRREDDVYVVRNAPDLQLFRPVDPDESLRKDTSFLIGYVGLMGPQDGVDHTIHALAALKKGRSDWRAVFVGEGDVLPEARRLAAEVGLDGMVHFTGWVGGDRLVSILASLDVCVAPNPKTPLNEVSTMVKLLEYMAMSRPVVAYDLAETRRTAQDAVAYAAPNEPLSLARRIDELLDDPERRERMGRLGRARIETVLSWEHAERQLLAAYDHAFHIADARRSRRRAGQRLFA